MTIEADRYRETREALKRDPIIIAMAKELATLYGKGARMFVTHDVDAVGHQGDTPRFEFMQNALAAYKARGGKVDTHIGGPAEAILALLEEPNGP